MACKAVQNCKLNNNKNIHTVSVLKLKISTLDLKGCRQNLYYLNKNEKSQAAA